MKIYKYLATVKHDTGKIRIKTAATSIKNAILIICKFERCPESAITEIKKLA